MLVWDTFSPLAPKYFEHWDTLRSVDIFSISLFHTTYFGDGWHLYIKWNNSPKMIFLCCTLPECFWKKLLWNCFCWFSLRDCGVKWLCVLNSLFFIRRLAPAYRVPLKTSLWFFCTMLLTEVISQRFCPGHDKALFGPAVEKWVGLLLPCCRNWFHNLRGGFSNELRGQWKQVEFVWICS